MSDLGRRSVDGTAGAETIRAALRAPSGARGSLGALVGRVPLAVGVLVIVALVHGETGSYALAGIASGVFGLAMAAGHPWLGRLVDGERGERVLVLTALISAGGWFAMTLCINLLPAWTAFAGAAVAGGFQPPLSPAMRARWSQLMAPHALERAYAFETTVQEVAFIAGPLLLSLLLVLSTPTVAALGCGTLVVAGALLFASGAIERGPREPEEHGGHRPMSAPGVRTIALTRGFWSVAIGIALVCIPAFAIAHGGPELAGVIIAAWSFGCLLGGAAYGAIPWRGSLARRHLAFLWLGVLPMLALPLAHGVPLFAALAAVSGLGLAPWVASGDALVQRLAPAGAMTEAFSWTASLGLVGEAVGAVIAGLLLDWAGLSAALYAAAGTALAAALYALAANANLRGGEPGALARRRSFLGCPLPHCYG